jgi:pyrroline-5-carboxylate reductase
MAGLSQRIAFLGGGRMAEALIRALSDSGLAEPSQVAVSDVLEARRTALAALGLRAVAENREAVAGAGMVVLAVKPQDVPAVLDDVKDALAPGCLVVSIAAGVTIRAIETGLREKTPVVRVMPNTPVQVGAGAAAVAGGRHATAEHVEQVLRIFNAAGRAVAVPEKLLDAVTGLSGSGPAYICLIIEALADGGVKEGLPRDVALTLATQTVLGTAKLLQETGLHPAEWKDMVASPGGTTIAGLAALEIGAVRGALIACVEAATRRSQELGQK